MRRENFAQWNAALRVAKGAVELPQLLVIADDLTGAADCGAACARHGLSTDIVLGSDNCSEDVDVLSVDADTRHLSADQAAAKTTAALRRHAGNGTRLLFKKLDSTLRGNVAAELAAVIEACRTGARRPVAVLAPAFPAHGRTTRNGRQHIHGVPLEHTEMGRCGDAVHRSHLREILETAGLSSALLALDLVRCGDEALGLSMQHLAQQADVLVCDAETDQDLRAIADASMTIGPGVLWAGSAGLAYHLPVAAGVERSLTAPLTQLLASGPTLFVAGSLSSVTRQQVAALAASPGLALFEVPIATLLAGEQSPQWHATMQAVEQQLRSGADLLVLPAADLQAHAGSGPLITAAIARLVQPCSAIAGALVATGGETARAVMDSWDIRRFRVRAELEPGFPLSVTVGWKRQLPVLTKAGAFGNGNTLLHCRQFLHQLDRSGHAAAYTYKGI